jgi:hypothetical protein
MLEAPSANSYMGRVDVGTGGDGDTGPEATGGG